MPLYSCHSQRKSAKFFWDYFYVCIVASLFFSQRSAKLKSAKIFESWKCNIYKELYWCHTAGKKWQSFLMFYLCWHLQDLWFVQKKSCDFYHSILLHFPFNHSRHYYYKDSCNQNFHNTSSESVIVYTYSVFIIVIMITWL